MFGAPERSPWGPSPEEEGQPEPEAALVRFSKEELVLRLRREESARLSALAHRGQVMRGVNAELQAQLREVRELKALNARLEAENRELRELCLFLDQERLRHRSLASRWRSLFLLPGAANAGLALALDKARALQRLQDDVAGDNRELLRRLCLRLRGEEGEDPEEKDRDLGDGSSSTGSLPSPDQGTPGSAPEEEPGEEGP